MNHLLAELTTEEANRVWPQLELVPLERTQLICDQGDAIDHVYFPVSGMVSQMTTMQDRSAVETATVGREGVVGLLSFLGAEASNARCSVQVAGEAWRATSETLRDLGAANPGLSALIRRYAAGQIAAAQQLAACNLLHPLSNRCARSLLVMHDHSGQDDLLLTHEYLARILGVRRAGVTAALGVFQARGILTSRRGVITILDKEQLEGQACQCRSVLRDYSGLQA